MLTATVLEHEAARLTALLPPVPGRRWVVRNILQILVALCLAAAGRVEDAPVDAGAEVSGVPVMVVYRGRLRTGSMSLGVFGGLSAAAMPAIGETIVALARERGIRVTAAPLPRSRQQAMALRRLAESVTDRLRRGAAETDDSADLALEASADPIAAVAPGVSEPWPLPDPRGGEQSMG